MQIKVDSKIEYNFDELNRIVVNLSSKHNIHVGILGDSKEQRKEEGLSNSYVGRIHEFGSILNNIPERSFLRMPLNTKTDAIVNKAGELLKNAIKTDKKVNKIQILKKLGKYCENVIREAFYSNGFGKWKPLSEITKQNKKGANKEHILRDTNQLVDSITSEVSKIT